MPQYLKRIYTIGVFLAFLVNAIGPWPAYGSTGIQGIDLPKPGTMVHLSPQFNLPVL